MRDHWLDVLATRYATVLEDPRCEILVEMEGDEISSFLVLLHEQREGSTRRPESRIEFPSWLSSPGLLALAAQRARERGAEILATNVPFADIDQRALYEAVGMVAECQRIVLSLSRFGEASNEQGAAISPRVLARTTRGVTVRAAEYSDRLFLMYLATECVTMMFHERRSSELAAIQERFFDSYAQLDFAPDSPNRAWVASAPDGTLAGSILVEPESLEGPDGSKQAYINDISVLPAFWGRSVGASLALRAIEALKQMGIAYLAGDISTDNERVWSLASRLGFEIESLRYVQFLNASIDGEADTKGGHER